MSKLDWSEALNDEELFKQSDIIWASPEHMKIFQDIAERLRDCHTLIDAGCATGLGLPFWIHSAAIVFGIDKNIKCIEKARERTEKYAQIILLNQDIRNLESLTSRCDTIICKSVLKHFSPDEWEQVLAMFCRIASRQLVFSMNIAPEPIDQAPPNSNFYETAVPHSAISKVLWDNGWMINDTLYPDSREPIFFCKPLQRAFIP